MSCRVGRGFLARLGCAGLALAIAAGLLVRYPHGACPPGPANYCWVWPGMSEGTVDELLGPCARRYPLLSGLQVKVWPANPGRIEVTFAGGRVQSKSRYYE